MRNKTDFVIAWVDGSDPEWLKERAKYSQKYSDGDNSEARFRDWGTLKYVFRGIEQNASWVNKVYFLTYGHIPEFLNTENPKLIIVNHKDFIPDEYLPTFSSHVIELNLHRIKGLSEQFVYFNDDTILVNKVKETDFFRKGKPVDSAVLSPAIRQNHMGIGNVVLNNQAIINENFDKNTQIKRMFFKWFNYRYSLRDIIKNITMMPWGSFTGFYEFHLPNPFLKSTFREVWKKARKDLDLTCKNKFRNIKEDNNQWLFRDWQLASGNFCPRKTSFGKNITIKGHGDIIKVKKAANRNKVICVNDDLALDNDDYKVLSQNIENILNEKLKEKSSFEK